MAHVTGRQGYGRELIAAALIVGFATVWRTWTGGPASDAAPPSAPVAEQTSGARPLAFVDGTEITVDELAAECLARHGSTVLDTLINRRIIEQACRSKGLMITKQ